MKKRCAWVTQDPLYIDYHDNEWGIPVFDDNKLFAMLCLEGAQAGLSWITILKKRQSFYQAFDQFDAKKIAEYDEKKCHELLHNPDIIRNKLKINAFITNAQCYLKITETQTFSHYLWQFVNHKPIINHFENMNEVPNNTDISKIMSKQLKKDGFKFVGETICYAFMQATGMVDDHLLSCYTRNR